MDARSLGTKRAKKSVLPQISRGHFFTLTLFCFLLDGKRERGATRSLGCRWIANLSTAEISVPWSQRFSFSLLEARKIEPRITTSD